MAYDQNAGVKKNAVEARQGTRRPNLILVLGVSLVLVVVAFGAVWLYTAH